MSMRIDEGYGNDPMEGVPGGGARVSGERPEKPETCTSNTDRVDAEVKQLRQEKEQLRGASGDEKREAALKQKITRIDVELRMKDNDTYRRQNMDIHTVQ